MKNKSLKEILVPAIMLFVIAAVCTPIGMAVLYWIAKNEGRLELLMECIPSKKRPENGKKAIITIPLILAIVIALAFMIMSETGFSRVTIF